MLQVNYCNWDNGGFHRFALEIYMNSISDTVIFVLNCYLGSSIIDELVSILSSHYSAQGLLKHLERRSCIQVRSIYRPITTPKKR